MRVSRSHALLPAVLLVAYDAAACSDMGALATPSAVGELTPDSGWQVKGGQSALAAVRRATAPFHDVARAVEAGYLSPMGGHCDEIAIGAWASTARIRRSPRTRRSTPSVRKCFSTCQREPAATGWSAWSYLQTLLLRNTETGEVAPWFSQDPWPPQYVIVNPTPSIFGQTFQGPMAGHVPGMPWHYDLHVWIWAPNPSGMFVESLDHVRVIETAWTTLQLSRAAAAARSTACLGGAWSIMDGVTLHARMLMAAALCGVVSTGCARPNYIVAPPRVVTVADWPADRLTPHVVLVSVDGLRPDAIGTFETPTLQRLMREGAYTLTASTITPSKTLPSHTSMLTGLPPDRHGVLWNDVLSADADLIEVPTVFGVARSHGYRTAAFFSKPKFQPLQQPGSLDYSQAPGGWWGGWSQSRTLDDVEEHLAVARPNLLFVHFGDADRAGHSSGWMSRPYGNAVRRVDEAIARLLEVADAAFGSGNYTVIVTADHGGHGFDHGSDDPRDVLIPWIAWGRSVKVGPLRDVAVQTMDTASTVLWLLGIAEPADWAGTPILSAFRDTVAVAAE